MGSPPPYDGGGATHATITAGSRVAVETAGWTDDKMLRERYAKQAYFTEGQRRLDIQAAKELAADRVEALRRLLSTMDERSVGATHRRLQECSHFMQFEDTARLVQEQLRDPNTLIYKHHKIIQDAWRSERAADIRRKNMPNVRAHQEKWKNEKSAQEFSATIDENFGANHKTLTGESLHPDVARHDGKAVPRDPKNNPAVRARARQAEKKIEIRKAVQSKK